MASHWIFVVRDHGSGRRKVKAVDILHRRLQKGFWALNKRNPRVKLLRRGDRVVLYVAGKEPFFAGRATIASEPAELTPQQREDVQRDGFPSSAFTHAVLLSDVGLFEEPKPAKEFAQKLSFVKGERSVGKYLRGGIRRIDEADYNVLIGL